MSIPHFCSTSISLVCTIHGPHFKDVTIYLVTLLTKSIVYYQYADLSHRFLTINLTTFAGNPAFTFQIERCILARFCHSLGIGGLFRYLQKRECRNILLP